MTAADFINFHLKQHLKIPNSSVRPLSARKHSEKAEKRLFIRNGAVFLKTPTASLFLIKALTAAVLTAAHSTFLF